MDPISSKHFASRVQGLYQEAKGFDDLAMDIFSYQAKHNTLYSNYLDYLKVIPEKIDKVSDIPCLPISFFKNHEVKSGAWKSETVFSSSGTGGAQSYHHVSDKNAYLKNTALGFNHFFGGVQDYCYLALLPSYLERKGSSLVYMLQHFIDQSKYSQSGFYLNQFTNLTTTLKDCIQKEIPTILFGVPFGLLDFGELAPLDLSKITIIETGGMKGRREELTKANLYKKLDSYFQPKAIYSEYGMTELFSQAYALSLDRFQSSPSMDIYIREINDPFNYLEYGRLGAINTIDLANFDTLSFIATDDLGRKHADETFEVLGRLDNSDLRGCNLLLEEL